MTSYDFDLGGHLITQRSDTRHAIINVNLLLKEEKEVVKYLVSEIEYFLNRRKLFELRDMSVVSQYWDE